MRLRLRLYTAYYSICYFVRHEWYREHARWCHKQARHDGSGIASPAEATAGHKGGGKGKNPLKEQIRKSTTDKKLAVTRQTVARWIETSCAATVATGATLHPQSAPEHFIYRVSDCCAKLVGQL